jgi:tetrapyrrole methylase family protein/MazG family protein
MKSITIVGMGPGSASYLTMEAYKILLEAKPVYLRTKEHPVVAVLENQGMTYESFDYIYEMEDIFDNVYSGIVDVLLEKAQESEVVYAVPGNPFVAEKTVSLLLEKATENALDVKIIHGVSFLDAIITTLKYDPVSGLVVADALSIDRTSVDIHQDYVWIQVYNKLVASELKLKLSEVYEDDHPVKIIQAAGIPDMEKVVAVSLWELDHDETYFNHLTSVFVPRTLDDSYNMFDLIQIMKKLRSEEGCPWDREQTHESLAPYLIEEAYEVKHAIFKEDDEAVVDELGDVLLQIVFHAAIAEEDGYFSMKDIYRAICEKMIRRHPHVFGDVHVSNSEDVLKNWQSIKDVEKENQSIHESMKSVSESLPALIRSPKVQKKAADVGFDWGTVDGIFEKMDEEINELKEAVESGEQAKIAEELGDLLLVITNLSRRLKVDAEISLNDAIDKFIDRFGYVENNFRKTGKELSPEFVSDMEIYWAESKKR